MLDVSTIKGTGSAHHAMDFISFTQEKLGKIGPVLSGNSCDQNFLGIHGLCPYLQDCGIVIFQTTCLIGPVNPIAGLNFLISERLTVIDEQALQG